uniref:Uncharacterized protein n=1 Tax=Aegilops tauschii subsp. strangulata TaxID=200361 RepID=A0A453E5L8_AEGTS
IRRPPSTPRRCATSRLPASEHRLLAGPQEPRRPRCRLRHVARRHLPTSSPPRTKLLCAPPASPRCRDRPMLPHARIRPREVRTLRIRPPPRRIQRYLYGDPAFSSPLPQALNRPVPDVREALLAEEAAPGLAPPPLPLYPVRFGVDQTVFTGAGRRSFLPVLTVAVLEILFVWMLLQGGGGEKGGSGGGGGAAGDVA